MGIGPILSRVSSDKNFSQETFSRNHMATVFSTASISSKLYTHHHHVSFPDAYRSFDCQKTYKLQCNLKNTSNTSSSSSSQESEPENLLLKMAWYGSELLGIAASFVRPPKNVEAPQGTSELALDRSGITDRNSIVEAIKDDFQRSYFVTGSILNPTCQVPVCLFTYLSISHSSNHATQRWYFQFDSRLRASTVSKTCLYS